MAHIACIVSLTFFRAGIANAYAMRLISPYCNQSVACMCSNYSHEVGLVRPSVQFMVRGFEPCVFSSVPTGSWAYYMGNRLNRPKVV